MTEIRYIGSYEHFLLQARVSLNVGANHCLYELRPGNTQEQKARISTKAELERSLEFVDNSVETAESLQTLFLYPEDITLNSSPATSDVKGASEGDSDDNDCSYPEFFAREVQDRDGKCRICGTIDALVSALIVDASERLTAQQELVLGLLNHKYYIWNGILLCANCHHKYDHWQYGIDGEGYLWRKTEGRWAKDERVNIFPEPACSTSRRFPDPKLLKWKFEQFESKRDQVLTKKMK